MLKANSSALFQGTNIAVATIRQTEISYYVSVSQSFATQAALLGGFTYGALQNASDGAEWAFDLDAFYAVFGTLTIILAVHIVLCCLFLQVYGPGRSLYGAVGSVAKTADVLRKEQPMIVKSFVLMLACFVASTVALFWSVLDYISATICSVSLGIAVLHWYHYLLRIYAQLKWDHHSDNIGSFGLQEEEEDPATALQRAQQSTNNDIEMATSKRTSPSTVLDGYLTRKFLTSSSNKWERNYFVLDSKGVIFAFFDRKDYRQDINPVSKERPIFLEDCWVTFDFVSITQQIAEQNQLFTQALGKPFCFLLVNKDKQNNQKMLFACDTQEELDLWKAAILKVLQLK